MVKTQSVATVAEIADQFRTSSAAVITEYRGLTMKQITTLRKALGSTTQYTVAKNTLVKRAAADAGVEGLDDLFTGPTAIAFVKGDPSDAAKAIREFAKTNPLLVIKGGYLEGKALAVADVSKIADLESREVLLAKFAGAMKANLSKAAYTFAALPSQLVRLAAALQEKLEAEGPAVSAAPAAEAAPEAPAAEAAAAAVATSDDSVVNAEVKQAEAASTEAPVEAPAVVEETAVAAEAATEAPAADAADAATSDDGVVNAEVTQAEAASTEAPVEAPTAVEETAAAAEAATDSPAAGVAADASAEAPTSDDGVDNAEAKQAEAASTEAPADLA